MKTEVQPGNMKGKKSLERPTRGWEDNIRN
jgi:hypothetical protein